MSDFKNYFDKINASKYIFLEDIVEPDVNSLSLIIAGGIVSDDESSLIIGNVSIDGLKSIEVTEQSVFYRLFFNSYVAYNVINESYSYNHPSEIYKGHTFRIFEKSYYLDYLKEISYSYEILDGKYTHYMLSCQNHVVDVISEEEPEINFFESYDSAKASFSDEADII